MRCVIECIKPFKNIMEIITLKDGKIFYDDGRYEKMILDDGDVVSDIYESLFKTVFKWKQEYIGERIYDGEKYLIEFDVNHKKKKYKIQNKFPENWNEFIDVKNRILSYDEE